MSANQTHTDSNCGVCLCFHAIIVTDSGMTPSPVSVQLIETWPWLQFTRRIVVRSAPVRSSRRLRKCSLPPVPKVTLARNAGIVNAVFSAASGVPSVYSYSVQCWAQSQSLGSSDPFIPYSVDPRPYWGVCVCVRVREGKGGAHAHSCKYKAVHTAPAHHSVVSVMLFRSLSVCYAVLWI